METEGPFMKRDVKGSGSDEGTERAQPLFPCLSRYATSRPHSSLTPFVCRVFRLSRSEPCGASVERDGSKRQENG